MFARVVQQVDNEFYGQKFSLEDKVLEILQDGIKERFEYPELRR